MGEHAAPARRARTLLDTLRMLAAVPGARRLPYRPRAAIERARDRRVRAAVRWAYDTVPFYRDRMDEAGIAPDRIRGADDLALLPTISAADLRADPVAFLSRRYPPERCHLISTSGRAGVPKPVYHDPASLMKNVAWGERHEAVYRLFAGPRHRRTILTLGTTTAVARHIQGEYRRRLRLIRFLAADRTRIGMEIPFGDQVAALNRLEPDVVSSVGSFAGGFFRAIHEGGLETHLPRLISGGSDAMPAADRRIIEEELGVPVIMTYQSAESLKIGFECEARAGYHLHEDLCHVRLLDDQGRDVPTGEVGRVHIGNLVDRATVLLNYDLGDRARFIAGECACGRTLRRIELVEGRQWPLLRSLDGGAHHASTIVDPLQDLGIAGKGQVVVERPDRWRVRLPPPPRGRPEDWEERARAVIRDIAGPGIEIEIEAVDRPPRNDVGKWVPIRVLCQGTPPYPA